MDISLVRQVRLKWRTFIYIGLSLGLLHIVLLPTVSAANLLVMDRSDRWQLGVSVSGSSVSKVETSLIHLTEGHYTVANRDIIVSASYRPRPNHRWIMSAHHGSRFEEIELVHLTDPVIVSYDLVQDQAWRSLDLGFEYLWNFPRQRSLQLFIGTRLCTFKRACRVDFSHASLGFSKIVDPVVVGVSLGTVRHASPTGSWAPSLSGAVEFVINGSLATGSFLSLVWASEGHLGHAVLGQKLVWRFDEHLMATVGVQKDLLGNEPKLTVSLQTKI